MINLRMTDNREDIRKWTGLSGENHDTALWEAGFNLDGIGYLYPCLVTRYSSINPDRTKNNPYVAKHYFDGEDFVNCGEEVCSEYILAWMPLPQPWKGADNETD